jgi:ribosomal protein S18 acetylase RimI-like enzyme
MPLEIRSLCASDLDAELPRLVALLQDAVHTGSGLGFQAPLGEREASAYWRSVRPELEAGTRLLLAAYRGGHLVGAGQLQWAAWSAGQHRAELQKLVVDSALRGGGVGAALVAALHEAALQQQRSLIVLNTRHGSPAVRFYKRLGYREAGVIPGFARARDGTSHATLFLYQDLADAAPAAL